MWVRRRRQKRGGRLAKVRVQDDASTQELQDKAPPGKRNRGQNLGSRLVRPSDAKLAPPNRPVARFKQYGQISGAFRGSDSGREIGADFRPTLTPRRGTPHGARATRRGSGPGHLPKPAAPAMRSSWPGHAGRGRSRGEGQGEGERAGQTKVKAEATAAARGPELCVDAASTRARSRGAAEPRKLG